MYFLGTERELPMYRITCGGNNRVYYRLEIGQMETAKSIDHALMRRIQKEEYDAFEQLVDRYKTRLVNLLHLRAGNTPTCPGS